MSDGQQRVSRQEYVFCHELVHLRVPEHGKGWQALMGVYLPGWRQRGPRLAGWVLQGIWKRWVQGVSRIQEGDNDS